MKIIGKTSIYDKLILESLDKGAQCGKELFYKVKDKIQEKRKRTDERSFQEALYRLLSKGKIEIIDFNENCDDRKRKQTFTYHAFIFERRHKNKMEDILQLLNKFMEDHKAAKRLRRIFKAKIKEANKAYEEDVKAIKENLTLIPQRELIEKLPPLKKELKERNILNPFQQTALRDKNKKIWCLEREVEIRHPFYTIIDPKDLLPVNSNSSEEWPIIICTWLEGDPYTDRYAKTKEELIKKIEREMKCEPYFFMFPVEDEKIDKLFEELLLDLLDPESSLSKGEFAHKLSDLTHLSEFISMVNAWGRKRALDELEKELRFSNIIG